MLYMIRKNGRPSDVAHHWRGQDTYCDLFLRTLERRAHFLITDTRGVFPLCNACQIEVARRGHDYASRHKSHMANPWDSGEESV